MLRGRSDFWYTISANAEGGVPRTAEADRFPAQEGYACRGQEVIIK